MNRHISLGLAMIASAALGAAAVQSLYAQSKAYYVVEIELLDAAASAAYTPVVEAAQRTAGGRLFGTVGKRIVAFEGTPPKRVVISEWNSMDQLQAYRNSAAFKNLAPQRDKAIKIVRSYAVEGPAN
jgi:uncharacterized protein (DUF1330 family)